MPRHLGAWGGITFPSTPFPVWVARGLNCQQNVSTTDVKMFLASFVSLALNFNPLPFLPAGTVMARTNMAAMHFFDGKDAVSQSSWMTIQLPSNMEHSPPPIGERQQATLFLNHFFFRSCGSSLTFYPNLYYLKRYSKKKL